MYYSLKYIKIVLDDYGYFTRAAVDLVSTRFYLQISSYISNICELPSHLIDIYIFLLCNLRHNCTNFMLESHNLFAYINSLLALILQWHGQFTEFIQAVLQYSLLLPLFFFIIHPPSRCLSDDSVSAINTCLRARYRLWCYVIFQK